ncbi:Synaptosomal-associated protein 25 [Gryllus bimaculatus]|nr:Synaptosomal-associated protein 25 [Gryllus bimaculatus]
MVPASSLRRPQEALVTHFGTGGGVWGGHGRHSWDEGAGLWEAPPLATPLSGEVGMKTLVMLDEQGEQLDRIEEGMDQINADMHEAERNLSGMEKCCGLCVLPCGKGTSFKEDDSTWKGTEDGRVVDSQPNRIAPNSNGAPAPAPQGGFVTRITNDAREDEMEENMGQVSNMIGTLRNMALDMGSELENQNKQLDRVNRKGESNEARIANANQRAHNLLK